MCIVIIVITLITSKTLPSQRILCCVYVSSHKCNKHRALNMLGISPFTLAMATAEPVDYVQCSACGIRQQIPSISPHMVRFCLGLWPRRPMCERCCTCKACINVYRILVETSVCNYLSDADDSHRAL